MNKEYKYTFKQIIENFNSFKLGTIIESDYGIKYKMTKTDNDRRKFLRVNKGLRFMTYDNMDRLFRIVEQSEQDIDIQAIEETEIKNDGSTYYEYPNGGYTESGYTKNYCLDDIETRIKINELVRAVKQLDNKIKEK